MPIFLIPCPIAEGKTDTIPQDTITALHKITHFIAERAKTARHYLKASRHPVAIQEIEIFEIDKHDPGNGLYEYLNENAFRHDIGVISEAGCPGIADPGANIVAWAHKKGIQVKPMVGPSSILLALMASGFSGQQFTFHGYLPHKRVELLGKLKQLEKDTLKTGATQIFMETPYRNKNMIKLCCEGLQPKTRLSIAADITSVSESIKTMTIRQWKNVNSEIYHKRPAIYLIGID